MIAKLLILVVSFSVAGPFAQQPASQAGEEQPQEGSNRARRPKNRITKSRPVKKRNSGRLLPSEREERELERWLRLAVRTYELDKDQEEMARREIEAIKAERREAMGDDAKEYDELKQQRDAMYETAMAEVDARTDLPVSDQMALKRERRRELRKDSEFIRIQERMREIESAHALNMSDCIARIEQLLPEDQVRRAADKRRIMEERRAQRLEEQARQVEERRRLQAKQARERRRSAPPVVKAVTREAAETGERGNKPAAKPRQTGEHQQAEQRAPKVERRDQPAAKAAAAPVEPRAKDMHPWEKYVREFIVRYDLTERQENAAMSILQDSLKREQQYIQAYTPRIEAAKKIADKAKQDAELAKLRQPRDYIFKELTKRLDTLLTAAQRAKAKADQKGKRKG